MPRTQLLKRALYVVPVVGAMVFGTTQVFASTTAPQTKLACSRGCFVECGPVGGLCSSSGFCYCR